MRKLLVGSLLGLAVMAAGCGSGTVEVAPDENGEVLLEMSEFSFGVDAVQVNATCLFPDTPTRLVGGPTVAAAAGPATSIDAASATASAIGILNRIIGLVLPVINQADQALSLGGSHQAVGAHVHSP